MNVSAMSVYGANPIFRQRGAVLAVSLLLLLGMVLVGVVATKTAMLEQRMARNEMSSNIAFQASETALRDAEKFLDELTSLPHEIVCNVPACSAISGVSSSSGVQIGQVGAVSTVLSSDDTKFDTAGELVALTLENWDAHGQSLKTKISVSGPPVTLANVGRQPKYIIIEKQFVPDGLTLGTGVPPGRYLYQITASGTGQQDNTQRVLQSTFIRRY